MKLIILLFAIFFTTTSEARLIDKIAAVFNDKTISLSEINRARNNLVTRRSIAPHIYTEESYTHLEFAQKLVRKLTIREHLSEAGFIVSDEQVDSQIRATESRLGLQRRDLLNFLNDNNTTFEEYFEIIRETIEFSIFNSRIISPLINITEQEIKNRYYSMFRDNQTVSFKYHLISFSMPARLMNQGLINEFPHALRNMQTTGVIPERFRQMITTDMGQITEDSMADVVLASVRNIEEGEFGQAVRLGENYHVFHVRERDLVESSHYRRNRDRIYEILYQEAFDRVSDLWFERQFSKHYITYNL